MKKLAVKQVPPFRSTRLKYGTREWIRELMKRDPRCARAWLNKKCDGHKIRTFELTSGRRIQRRKYVPQTARGNGASTGSRLRIVERGGQTWLAGRASVFWNGSPGSQFELLPGLYERFERTAFEQTLAEDDVRGLYSHNTERLLGRASNGTLKLETDGVGLRYLVRVPSHEQGLVDLVARGDLRGSSIGFQIRADKIEEKTDHAVRWIRDVKLFEVSAVAFPAYRSTEL